MTQETVDHSVGERCCLDEHKGTIRYTGEVPPTKGLWYGVEWDDERGKHNGTLNEVTYFTCKEKHGSFVRPHKVSFGVDATSIIQNTYGEGVYIGEEIVLNDKSKSQEKVIEMVGFDKIALQQSDLSSLKEVDLSSTIVSHGNIDTPIQNICPNLVFLDLRKTLISSIKEVFEIAGQIKHLKVLNISENKIHSWEIKSEGYEDNFSHLETLYVNSVDIDWEQLVGLLGMMPAVSNVHACFNPRILDPSPHKRVQGLKILNLEGCSVTSWESINTISLGSKLEWLILNDNQIPSIDFQAGVQFENLKTLSISGNTIEKWTSVNELRKITSLKELRFRNNPIAKGLTSFQLRQELVARLDNVNIVNGSEAGTSERRVAEMTYIKKYSKDYLASLEDGKISEFFQIEHPRYAPLVEIHGAPVEEKAATVKLKEALLSLTMTCPDCESKKSIIKKVPATMTVQQLKGIVQRAFKVPNTKQKLSYLDQKNSREIDLDDNMKQLSYYSVSNGDTVYVRW